MPSLRGLKKARTTTAQVTQPLPPIDPFETLQQDQPAWIQEFPQIDQLPLLPVPRFDHTAASVRAGGYLPAIMTRQAVMAALTWFQCK